MTEQEFLSTKESLVNLFNENWMDGYYGTPHQWIFFINHPDDKMEVYFKGLDTLRLFYMPPFPDNVIVSVMNPYNDLIRTLGQWSCPGQESQMKQFLINTLVDQLKTRTSGLVIPEHLKEPIEILTKDSGLLLISSQLQLDRWNSIALYDPILQKIYNIPRVTDTECGQHGHMLRTWTGGRIYQMNSKRVFPPNDYRAINSYLTNYRNKRMK